MSSSKGGVMTIEMVNRIIWSSLEHSHNAQGFLIKAIEEIMGKKRKKLNLGNDLKRAKELMKTATNDIDYLTKEVAGLKKKNKRLAKMLLIKTEEVARLRFKENDEVLADGRKQKYRANLHTFDVYVLEERIGEVRSRLASEQCTTKRLSEELAGLRRLCFRQEMHLNRFRRCVKEAASPQTAKLEQRESQPRWHSSFVLRPTHHDMGAQALQQMDDALNRLEAKVKCLGSHLN